MFGSARSVQVTLGLRQLAAAIVTFALVTVLALVVAVGQFTTSKATSAPAAAPVAAPPAVVDNHGSGSGGPNHYLPE